MKPNLNAVRLALGVHQTLERGLSSTLGAIQTLATFLDRHDLIVPDFKVSVGKVEVTVSFKRLPAKQPTKPTKKGTPS